VNQAIKNYLDKNANANKSKGIDKCIGIGTVYYGLDILLHLPFEEITIFLDLNLNGVNKMAWSDLPWPDIKIELKNN